MEKISRLERAPPTFIFATAFDIVLVIDKEMAKATALVIKSFWKALGVSKSGHSRDDRTYVNETAVDKATTTKVEKSRFHEKNLLPNNWSKKRR